MYNALGIFYVISANLISAKSILYRNSFHKVASPGIITIIELILWIEASYLCVPLSPEIIKYITTAEISCNTFIPVDRLHGISGQ